MHKNIIYSNILFELERIGRFGELILDKVKRKIAGAVKMPPPSSSALIKAYHELLKTQQPWANCDDCWNWRTGVL